MFRNPRQHSLWPALAVLTLAGCAAPHRLDGPVARPLPAMPVPPPPPASAAPLPALRPNPPRVVASTAPAPAKIATPAAAASPSPTAAAPPNPDTAASARQLLQQSYQYTGLTDAQLAQQKAAEAMLARGDEPAAYAALKHLDDQIRTARKSYAVKSGDSLWIISGKPEIYGNPWLWPLIWQTNIKVVPNPDRLGAGQQLDIRPNPSIDEVVKAVDYARAQSKTSQTRIGEVKEAPAGAASQPR